MEVRMTKAEVLEKAASIVTGNREQNYGKPEDNFATIAQIWTAVLQRTGKISPGSVVDARDVALCMVGVKLAREAHIHSDDNCVDGAGYFACAADVVRPSDKNVAVTYIEQSGGNDYRLPMPDYLLAKPK